MGHLGPMLVTPPTIGKLLQRPRRWAQRRVVAGAFGPIMRRRGRTYYVDLAGVEAFAARHFTKEQLAAAAGVKQPQENY
jgi:hypothetical protein